MITSGPATRRALIGDTGYVGSSLLRQAAFASTYRSANIAQIDGRDFDLVVCAAAPGKKWLANKDPQADQQSLALLMTHLDTISCQRFVLISTVDVFKNPLAVDETTQVDEAGLHAYGRHRRGLETFVASRFPNHLIIRLPGLVGPGLRKNIVFDLLHENDLHAVDSRSVFQFYPMVNLWSDIATALQAGLPLLHLTAEPISVAEVAEAGFGRTFEQMLPGVPAAYDMRSRYAEAFATRGHYQYSRRETLLAIRAYAQTEPRCTRAAP